MNTTITPIPIVNIVTADVLWKSILSGLFLLPWWFWLMIPLAFFIKNYKIFNKFFKKVFNTSGHEINKCPRCGGNLVNRSGKYGNFIGCSNYPKCKYTKQI
jgi:hypothetical protein